MNKIKIKQLTSGNELSGKTLISNGSGSFVYDYPQIEKGITLPLDATNGDLFYHTSDYLLYQYDSIRAKWLSVERMTLLLGKISIANNVSGYLCVADAVQSSTTGIKMYRNGTIVAASVDNINNMSSNRDIEIRVNNSESNKITLTINSENKSNIINNANLNFNTNDLIQAIAINNNSEPDLSNIILMIEIAWRN